MHHGTEFWVVLLAIAVLTLGAATRALARRLRVPYTIALLLAGVLAGLALNAAEPGGTAHHLISLASQITPASRSSTPSTIKGRNERFAAVG